MEDHIIIPKNIIDDWKFQDEGVLKFWILLLIEETEAEKDKDGLFIIRNITQMAKKAGLERRKATRVIKRMEQDKSVTLSPIHCNKNEPTFSIVNSNIKTKISIKKEAILEQNAKASAKSATDLKVNTEADNICFQEDKTPRHEPMFSIEPEASEYFKWEEEFERENGIKNGGFLLDTEKLDSENEFSQKSAQFPSHSKTSNEAAEADSIYKNQHNMSHNFLHNIEPKETTPLTKKEEERKLRRHALRTALKVEIGYLKNDETVNRFFNELSKEYDGSSDKEIQLAVRKNLLRKVHGSFENTLEIKKAELYAEYKHNPYILAPANKKLCEDLLDPEFLEVSKKEKVQYDEQQMIKINIRGPRNIGDVAKEIVANFSAKANARSVVDLKTNNKAGESDSELDKTPRQTPRQTPNSPPNTILTDSDPSNQVGTELAFNTINTIKNSESTCTSTCTSTVHKNKLNNIFLDKRGCGGEKGQENFVAETPTEKLPVEKISKVAENHPDGRPAFSTKTFKSLPRAKQIQIIGERLSEIAELFPTIDVEFQFDHWKDWMDAKGQSFKDYSAAFRNWLRKSLDFAAKNSASNPTKIYTETGAKFVTQEVFTNPAHVPFKKDVPRNPNLKRRPGIGGVE